MGKITYYETYDNIDEARKRRNEIYYQYDQRGYDTDIGIMVDTSGNEPQYILIGHRYESCD